jgi:hypothetical protein
MRTLDPVQTQPTAASAEHICYPVMPVRKNHEHLAFSQSTMGYMSSLYLLVGGTTPWRFGLPLRAFDGNSPRPGGSGWYGLCTWGD